MNTTSFFKELFENIIECHRLKKEFQNNIVEFISKNSGLKEEICSLKEEFSGLQGEFSGLKDELSGIKEDILSIKLELSDFKTELSDFKTELSDFQTSQEETIKKLENLEKAKERNSKDIEVLTQAIKYCLLNTLYSFWREYVHHQGYATMEQKKYVSDIYKVYHNELNGNNIGEKYFSDIMDLPEERV